MLSKAWLGEHVYEHDADPDSNVIEVYINRLRSGMRLESDPAVIYGISRGRPLGRGITRSELTTPTPYNTYMVAGLPPTPDVATMPVSTEVVDRNGQLLRPFTTPDGRWRLPVGLDDVDRRFIDMLIAYEDQRFKEHGGVDWSSMVRAAGQFALAGGRIVSGGSTLTMQVARLIEGEPTRNLAGKVRQMVHAEALERQLGKDDIIELYLSLAP